MSNAGGVIVAIRMRKERQIVAALVERSALSAQSATPLGPSEGLGRGALRSLLRSGAVIEVGSGSYYLDNTAYDKMRSQRRIRIGLIVLVVLAAAAAGLFMNTPTP